MAHAWRFFVRTVVVRASAPLLAAIVAVGVLLGTAVPAAACSCVQPRPMAAYVGDPGQTVFTGIVGRPDARGVPVNVTRWFQGPSTEAVVWLEAGGFGVDGAACGTPLPPAGTEWIFVAYRIPEGGLGVNLCTPHAAAGDPTGQSMFADALAAFGQGTIVAAASDPPTTAPEVPAVSGGETTPVPAAAVAGLALAFVAVIAGLGILVGRRRPGQRA